MVLLAKLGMIVVEQVVEVQTTPKKGQECCPHETYPDKKAHVMFLCISM
jgi:hypothetical protein